MNGEDREFVERLFVTLTAKNGMPHKALGRMADKFCQALSYRTRCHVYAARGADRGKNSHEHIIILVEKEELDRFNKRFPAFNSSKAWRYVHQVEPFEHSLKENAYTYTLVKHEPVEEEVGKSFFCPLYYNRCKKKNCVHKGKINWKRQLETPFLA